MCYRHPQRETYLRCNRCNRSICADCLLTAAVGFHCPECVRGPSRDVAPVLTVAGGKQRGRQGVATMAVIGVCIVIFGLQSLIGDSFTYRLNLLAMEPSVAALPSSTDIGVAYGIGEWYRLFTCMFVHENLLHLGTNMLSLWWIGVPVEARLGRTRYVLVYLTCGLVGSAVSYAFLAWNDSSLGASGAIFGMLGVLTVFAFREKLDMQPIIVTFMINAAIAFGIPNVDWHAHLGGLVAGVVLGAAVAYAPRRRGVTRWFSRPQNYLPTIAGAALLMLSAVIVLIHSSNLQMNSGVGATAVHSVPAAQPASTSYPQNT